MISIIRNGGMISMILGAIIIALVKIQWYIPIWTEPAAIPSPTLGFGGLELHIGYRLAQVICLLLILIQAFWLNSLVNRESYFERSNDFTIWFYVLFSLLTWQHTFMLGPLILNTILLYIFHRLLYLNDETLAQFGVHLDIGTAFGIAVMFNPVMLLLLPLFMLAINQFARLDANRFLIFMLGAVMISVFGLSMVYVFGGIDVLQWLSSSFDHPEAVLLLYVSDLQAKAVVSALIALLIFIPLLINSMTRSQIHARKFFRMTWILILFSVPMYLFEPGVLPAIQFIAIPVSISWAVIAVNGQRRWISELVLLCVLWALFLLPLSYF